MKPQEISQAAIDEMARHPLTRAFLTRQEATNGEGFVARNSEPWHAIGEKYVAAILVFGSMLQQESIQWRGRPVPVQPNLIGVRIARATPYLWSDEMRTTALASPLPPHTISSDLLPAPLMFWSWETGYGTKDENGVDMGTNDWLAVLESSDRSGVELLWNASLRETMTLSHARFDYGTTWPSTDLMPGELETAEMLLKLCAFLNSPFTESAPERLDRPRRRELKRAGRPEDETVAVVKLRRKAERQEREGDPSEVDWQHQWWVTGHYRAQWYPSLEAHKVIWIAPHLKGPRDKPILERVYSVER